MHVQPATLPCRRCRKSCWSSASPGSRKWSQVRRHTLAAFIKIALSAKQSPGHTDARFAILNLLIFSSAQATPLLHLNPHSPIMLPFNVAAASLLTTVATLLVASLPSASASLQSCLQSNGVNYLDSNSGSSWTSAKTPFNKRSVQCPYSQLPPHTPSASARSGLAAEPRKVVQSGRRTEHGSRARPG